MLCYEILRFLCENNSETTIFIFTVSQKKKMTFYEFSVKSIANKV